MGAHTDQQDSNSLCNVDLCKSAVTDSFSDYNGRAVEFYIARSLCLIYRNLIHNFYFHAAK